MAGADAGGDGWVRPQIRPESRLIEAMPTNADDNSPRMTKQTRLKIKKTDSLD